ncbi:MAG: hypothetical protein ACI8U4_000611 [Natronomonas sp.]|jgi:hypothetical protein
MSDRPAEDPGEGFIQVREAVLGVAFMWLAAMSGFGAIQATAYGATTERLYFVVAVGAASLAVVAAYASLRAFGVR